MNPLDLIIDFFLFIWSFFIGYMTPRASIIMAIVLSQAGRIPYFDVLFLGLLTGVFVRDLEGCSGHDNRTERDSEERGTMC